jgi:pimeloyl-ACP methyl ester carboxylesterase
MTASLRTVTTPTLEIAYEQAGPPDGPAVVLLHGFPYDVRAYDAVVPRLAGHGLRTLVPYLRGYGPTRFRSAHTMRSGQQAALGQDVRELLDALAIEDAVLAGYDWGGRAACVVAALWPHRVRGLVTVNGYNVQDIAGAAAPATPAQEHRYWYQYYFNVERGRAGLAAQRDELCKLLWQQWSPSWQFDDATYARTAASFGNPDFVDVVIHSYRHRYGYAAGDPALEPLEAQLAKLPAIAVPTVILEGDRDGFLPAQGAAHHARHFTAACDYRLLAGAGHNVPQEAPDAFADAVIAVRPRSAG